MIDEKYRNYLLTPEWAEKRKQVWQRAQGQCERCHSAPMAHVHHKNYNRLYREELEDLVALCKGCHEFLHGHNSYDPADTSWENILRWATTQY